jgi:hypothetical protein
MVSISLAAKVALIATGAGIVGAGALIFILTYLWWGSFIDSVLFFFLFIPIGLLLMLSAVIFGTKPSAPKYPDYSQFYPQYQGAGQYPPPPQNFGGQQRAYGQMYDQAYQYGYQYGYWLAMQKAAEQMYRAYRQPYQYYQQYYQYPM